MINKTIYMRCSQDSDYKPSAGKNVSKTGQNENQRIPRIHFDPFLQKEEIIHRRKRTVSQATKKIGCKAFLNITYIIVFRNIKVKNLQTEKREVIIIIIHKYSIDNASLQFRNISRLPKESKKIYKNVPKTSKLVY